MPARAKKSPAEQSRLAERDAAIFALLEERPYRTTELAEILTLPPGMHNVLKGLAKTGSIRRTGDDRWALVEYAGVAQDKSTESVTRRMDARRDQAQGTEPERRSRPTVAAETVPPAPNTPAAVVDGTLVAEPLIAPTPPSARHGRALRQPHERPPSITIDKDRTPSWWVNLPQNGFTDAALSQQERMRGSRENLHVPLRMIQ